MKLSDYVMQRIAEWTDTVYFVPGGGCMHLVDSLGHTDGLRPFSCYHEQGAAVAASTHAQYTGKLGVCLATTGPGSTNTVTGIAGAYMDGYPLLVITGQVKTASMKRDLGVRSFGSQEVDIVSGIRTYTKYAVTVMRAEDIKDVMNKAIEEAMGGRMGPVIVDIPLDVQAGEI